MNDDPAVLDARADSLVAGHRRLLRQLVEYRNKHNLSQDIVAERMGVTQPTVAAFERYDSNPTLSSIRRYAMAVEVRLDHEIVDDCVNENQFDAISRTTGLASWAQSTTFEHDYSTWLDATKPIAVP